MSSRFAAASLGALTSILAPVGNPVQAAVSELEREAFGYGMIAGMALCVLAVGAGCVLGRVVCWVLGKVWR